MVHALDEIRRVLAQDGILIDLRPLMDDLPLEVVSASEVRHAGMADHFPEDRASDEAANRSMARVEAQNWFIKEREDFFIFNYYWDSPKDMQEFIEAEWSNYVAIDEGIWRNVRSMWADVNRDARMRIPLRMLIARWKVVKND
jgi:hypothetical protein